MAEKKSILEEAMLDIKSIQNALNANTKEMLRSVAKEEIDSVVKESLNVEVYEEEDINDIEDTEDDGLGNDDMGGSEDEDSLGDIESPEGDDMGDMDADAMDEPMGGPMDGADDMDMEPEDGMDTDDVLGGDDMDMTAASDDEVMAVFKKMTGSDEIEIVGDEIHMNISEPGEYIIKKNNGAAPMGDMGGEEMGGLDDLEDMGDEDMDDMGGEDMDDMGGEEPEGPETEYQIDLDDEGGEGEEEPMDDDDQPMDMGGEEEEEEEGIEEQIAHSSAQAHKLAARKEQANPILGTGADNLKESVKTKKMLVETANKYNRLLTEATKLKAENEEFRAALKDFRTKLVETVIFNSNLTYATKIFLEHSTTKSEKDSIIKRFDEVGSLLESKKLYKTIANELKNRKPITESLESKIIKESTTSTSRQLNENTAYVDPSTKRIMDLIRRVENR